MDVYLTHVGAQPSCRWSVTSTQKAVALPFCLGWFVLLPKLCDSHLGIATTAPPWRCAWPPVRNHLDPHKSSVRISQTRECVASNSVLSKDSSCMHLRSNLLARMDAHPSSAWKPHLCDFSGSAGSGINEYFLQLWVDLNYQKGKLCKLLPPSLQNGRLNSGSVKSEPCFVRTFQPWAWAHGCKSSRLFWMEQDWVRECIAHRLVSSCICFKVSHLLPCLLPDKTE